MPTCTEPKLPPPGKTNAVFGRLGSFGPGVADGVGSAVMAGRGARHDGAAPDAIIERQVSGGNTTQNSVPFG
jgi:hypothetical protein